MNFYDKNMQCLKEHRLELFHSINGVDPKQTSNRLDEIKSITARNGEETLIIKFQSEEYRLNSLYNPSQEVERWVDQFHFGNISNLIVMYGFGNGIFARTLLNKMGDNYKLLVYEPSAELFLFVLEHFDISDILTDSRITLTVENVNEVQFHLYLQSQTNITNIKNQVKCIYPNYDKIFVESGIKFFKEIKDTYSHTNVKINTSIAFGKLYIHHICKNIKYIKNSNTIYELSKILPKDVPAIVVAAGPSVSKHIDTLKQAKGRAVIIAVDRILDYLLDSGVEPDFVVNLDPIKPIEYFSKRADVTVPLLTVLVSNHVILEHHKGKKIICDCTKLFEDFYKGCGLTPPRVAMSASVATMAFTICVELGYKNIILVGQDLAYDGDCTHAGGIEEKLNHTTDVYVEDIHGNLVRSRYDWKEFITWYQDFLSLYPTINLIDAKDSGAKIKGTTVMTLTQALELYSNPKGATAWDVDDMTPTFSTEELLKLKELLSNNLIVLDKIKEKSRCAVGLCNKLIQDTATNILSASIDKNLNKLSKINEYIYNQNVYTMIELYVAASTTKHLSEIFQLNNEFTKNSIHVFEKSKAIFEAITKAVEYIKPELEHAVHELQ